MFPAVAVAAYLEVEGAEELFPIDERKAIEAELVEHEEHQCQFWYVEWVENVH